MRRKCNGSSQFLPYVFALGERLGQEYKSLWEKINNKEKEYKKLVKAKKDKRKEIDALIADESSAYSSIKILERDRGKEWK
jgi:hypothetical protein